jgi:predicted RNA binding protein YcfA (HicA-like mRNA interferase family)
METATVMGMETAMLTAMVMAKASELAPDSGWAPTRQRGSQTRYRSPPHHIQK